MKEELLDKVKEKAKKLYSMNQNEESSFEDTFYKTFCYNIYGINRKDTNKIFVRGGTFIIDEEDELTFDEDPQANYRYYHDLEQFYSVNIPIQECPKFEKENYVINDKTCDYYKLRKEFIIDVLHNGQEIAKNNMIKKYVKKK